jgi:hypothetical protein
MRSKRKKGCKACGPGSRMNFVVMAMTYSRKSLTFPKLRLDLVKEMKSHQVKGDKFENKFS